ncbi:unnamed protein product, partial [marine sediment metagenome]
GKNGSVIDLCAEEKFNGKVSDAISFLAQENGLIESGEIVRINKTRGILRDVADFWHSRLPKEIKNYLTARGIREDTIDTLRVGWAENPKEYLLGKGYSMEDIKESNVFQFKNRIVFPYYKNGHIVYFVGRSVEGHCSDGDNAKYKKLKMSDFVEHSIWGVDTITDKVDEVFIIEGIFEAINCFQEGLAVLSPITPHFSKDQKKALFEILKGKHVVICFDHDPVTKSGEKSMQKLAEELLRNGINSRICTLEPPDESKKWD